MILDDVCEFIVDCPHSTANDEGHGYPLIRTPNVGKGRLKLDGVHRVSKDIYDKRNLRATPKAGDIIFAREAPAGNAALIIEGQEVCLGQRTVLIRPNKEKVYPKYLTYYILAPEQQYKLLGSANGATVAHVNLPIIRKMKISLPKLDMQIKIADILSSYDDLIENNQKQIKLLEEMAQRLYKEWFVDLHFPGYEESTIVNDMPRGWKRYKFSEKVSVMSGGTPKTDNAEYYNGTIPFYTPKDSDDSFWTIDTITHISEAGLNSCNSKYYPRGTVIITARGTVGKTTILSVPMAMNQSCYALKCDELDSPYYLFFSLNKEVQALKGMANGGVFNTIIVKTFDSIHIDFPNGNIVELFERMVTPVMREIECKIIENRKLSEARDRLLPKLMSGEIEV